MSGVKITRVQSPKLNFSFKWIFGWCLLWCWFFECGGLVHRQSGRHGWEEGGYWNGHDFYTYPHPAKRPVLPRDVMVEVVNSLGLKLLAIHNEHNENNLAISPYGALSILVALGEGLQGEAVKELQKAAHIPNDISVIRVGLRDIHRHLQSYFIPKEGFLAGLTLNHDNVTLRPEYEEILEFYGFDIMSFNNALYPDPLTTEKPVEVTVTENTGREITMVMTSEPTSTSKTTTSSLSITTTEFSVPITTIKNATTIITTEIPTTVTTLNNETPIIITTEGTSTELSTASTTKRVIDTNTSTEMFTTTEKPIFTAKSTERISTTEEDLSTGIDEITSSIIIVSTPMENVDTTTDKNNISPESITKLDMTTTQVDSTQKNDITVREIFTETQTQSIPTTAITSSTEIIPSSITTEEAPEETTTENVTTEQKVTEEITTKQATKFTTEFNTEQDNFVDQQTEMEQTSTEQMEETEQDLPEISTQPATTPILTFPYPDASTPFNIDITTEIINNNEIRSNAEEATIRKRKIRSKNTHVKTNNTNIRKPRSVLDYVIARYYDSYQPHNNPLNFPENYPFTAYVPQTQPSFLVQGKYREYQVNYMKYDTILPFSFVSHLNALALSFPLDNEKYYLLLLLPLDVTGIDKLICDLRLNGGLKYIIEGLRYKHVVAVIPSFMLKGYVNLTPTLQKLGIRRVFEPRQADFSPMTNLQEIYITNIEQAITVNIKNYVDPDTLNNRRFYRNEDPVDFRADHPFLYFVMDSELHVALMEGKIVNPLNSRIT